MAGTLISFALGSSAAMAMVSNGLNVRCEMCVITMCCLQNNDDVLGYHTIQYIYLSTSRGTRESYHTIPINVATYLRL